MGFYRLDAAPETYAVLDPNRTQAEFPRLADALDDAIRGQGESIQGSDCHRTRQYLRSHYDGGTLFNDWARYGDAYVGLNYTIS